MAGTPRIMPSMDLRKRRARPSILRCVDNDLLITFLPKEAQERLKSSLPELPVFSLVAQKKPPKQRKRPKKRDEKKRDLKPPPPKPVALVSALATSSSLMSASTKVKMAEIRDIDENYELNVVPDGLKYYGTDVLKKMGPLTPAKRICDQRPPCEKHPIMSTPALLDNVEEQKRPPTYIEHTSYIEPAPDEHIPFVQDDDLVRQLYPDGNIPEVIPSPTIDPEASPHSYVQKSASGDNSHNLKTTSPPSDDVVLQPPSSIEILRLRSGRTVMRSSRNKINSRGEIVSYERIIERSMESDMAVSLKPQEERPKAHYSTPSMAAALEAIAIGEAVQNSSRDGSISEMASRTDIYCRDASSILHVEEGEVKDANFESNGIKMANLESLLEDEDIFSPLTRMSMETEEDSFKEFEGRKSNCMQTAHILGVSFNKALKATPSDVSTKDVICDDAADESGSPTGSQRSSQPSSCGKLDICPDSVKSADGKPSISQHSLDIPAAVGEHNSSGQLQSESKSASDQPRIILRFNTSGMRLNLGPPKADAIAANGKDGRLIAGNDESAVETEDEDGESSFADDEDSTDVDVSTDADDEDEEQSLDHEDDEESQSTVPTTQNDELSDLDEDESFKSAKSCISTDNNLHASRLNKAMARLSLLDPRAVSRQSIVFDFEREVYRACGQAGPLPWDKAITKKMIDQAVKIGEGSYGEVFRSVNEDNSSVVLKVTPIEGSAEYNGAVQMTYVEIFPEIAISVSLSELRKGRSGNATPNFVEVKAVRCVKGRYPTRLLKTWKDYDATKGSENDSPSMFDDEQLFVVFIFSDGGCDLENVKFKSTKQAESVVRQIALTLAIAEKEFEFEHRDLHQGNVLVKDTTEQEIGYLMDGKQMKLETHGVHVFIIDFNLSRYINKASGRTLYMNLALDPAIFEGQGDYQFDIYRKMRDFNGNEWRTFHPKTNIFWLDYILDKLVTEKRYAANRRMTRKQAELFDCLRKDLDNFSSCRDFVSKCSFFGM